MKRRAAENGSGWQKIERDGDKPSRGLKKNRDVASTPQAIKNMEALLGNQLVNGNGDEVATSSLVDKVVGLYFSAHWCPPCRAFTPSLVDFYKKLKSSPRGDQFEIIFVSFDRSEGNFKSYFADMPWLAVPYNEQEVRESAGANFSVSGIPSLIFVNGRTGEVVVKDGRSKVTSDPNGNDFPWG
ncbi:Nucleoredoxin [Lamellibrachia satsuma]|nr:Nucleoredoxin [Lamellibrachia satsuma]